MNAAKLLVVAIAAMFSVVPVAMAQSCTEYLENQIRTMENAASDCGISGEMMHTAPGLNDPEELACQESIDFSSNQWTLLQQCARVYACASLSYQCALDRVNQGEDCQSAMEACIAEVGVPR